MLKNMKKSKNLSAVQEPRGIFVLAELEVEGEGRRDFAVVNTGAREEPTGSRIVRRDGGTTQGERCS